MKVEIDKACPVPMKDQSFSPDSIWRNSAVFETGKDHLVLAPSGTGKTSLLAFIFGMRSDYLGSIRINGTEVKDIRLAEWAELRRTRISLVMQDMRLIPTLTVEENLLIKNRLTKKESISSIKEKLDVVGLSSKWNQSCGTLSIGQQQRVSIVRSLLQPYEFLLLDEPFSHIDEENIRRASELILSTTRSNGASILMVSLGADYEMSFGQTLHL